MHGQVEAGLSPSSVRGVRATDPSVVVRVRPPVNNRSPQTMGVTHLSPPSPPLPHCRVM